MAIFLLSTLSSFTFSFRNSMTKQTWRVESCLQLATNPAYLKNLTKSGCRKMYFKVPGHWFNKGHFCFSHYLASPSPDAHKAWCHFGCLLTGVWLLLMLFVFPFSATDSTRENVLWTRNPYVIQSSTCLLGPSCLAATVGWHHPPPVIQKSPGATNTFLPEANRAHCFPISLFTSVLLKICNKNMPNDVLIMLFYSQLCSLSSDP